MKRKFNILLFVFLLVATFVFMLNHNLNKFFPDMTASEFTFFIKSAFDGGIKGTNYNLLKTFIKRCVLKPIFITLILFYLTDIIHFLYKKIFLKKGKTASNTNSNYFLKTKIYYHHFIGILSLILIFYYLSLMLKVLNKSKAYSDFYEKEYVSSQKQNIIFPQKKKNLIIIQVESLEKTFENKSFFGETLIPNIEKLEKEGIQFENYQNGFATSFTEGSLIALFTGIPCNIPGAGINMAGGRCTVFKNIYSLGKILKDNGYNTYSIQGTDSNFAGSNKFLKLHGIDEVIDINSLKQEFKKDIESKGWGLHDKAIFTATKNKIKNLNKNKPYFIYLQTIDMHAHYLPSVEIQKFKNPYYNVIYNTNINLADFINWLKKETDYKNTVIIIVGDHLRMGKDFKMPSKRQIYNLFLNTDKLVRNKNRTFTAIDMFPSILEAIGVEIKNHKLGIGTSIFSNKKTLSERFSKEYLDKELFKRNKLYETFW